MNSKYSLAISTINNSVSACIFKDMKVINQIHDPNQDNRNVSKLFKIMDQLLEMSKISYDEITEIFVSVGPGSFTAIRISLAFAMGLKIAKNIDVYGVSNLQLMAYLAQLNMDKSIIAQAYFLLDAGRDQIFIQALDITNLKELSNCELVDYSFLQAPPHLPLIADNEINQKLIQAVPSYINLTVNIINYEAIKAEDLGLCGALLKAHGLTKPLTPLYVRLPDAKPINTKSSF